jgi:hypothetical protein
VGHLRRALGAYDNAARLDFMPVAEFNGVMLKAFFTPEEITGVGEAAFRERDRLGYRAKYIGRFAEFFTEHDPDEVDHASKAELMTEFQTIKGVGPYTAAIIASHAVRDPSALGLDVWNRKLSGCCGMAFNPVRVRNTPPGASRSIVDARGQFRSQAPLAGTAGPLGPEGSSRPGSPAGRVSSARPGGREAGPPPH